MPNQLERHDYEDSLHSIARKIIVSSILVFVFFALGYRFDHWWPGIIPMFLSLLFLIFTREYVKEYVKVKRAYLAAFPRPQDIDPKIAKLQEIEKSFGPKIAATYAQLDTPDNEQRLKKAIELANQIDPKKTTPEPDDDVPIGFRS